MKAKVAHAKPKAAAPEQPAKVIKVRLPRNYTVIPGGYHIA